MATESCRAWLLHFAEESLIIGDVWEDQIRNAMESASAVVIIISASSLESQWVTAEWSHALKSNSVRLYPCTHQPHRFEENPSLVKKPPIR
jgi:hypothetical protein